VRESGAGVGCGWGDGCADEREEEREREGTVAGGDESVYINYNTIINGKTSVAVYWSSRTQEEEEEEEEEGRGREGGTIPHQK
jgi:hypothetical protein